MSRIAAACVAALGLAGCAPLRAPPTGPLGRPEPLGLAEVLPAQSQEAEPGDAVTCEMEQSTGSHIMHRVCRTTDERDRERDKAESLLHRGLQQGIIVLH
jgi:hypothetical protein